MPRWNNQFRTAELNPAINTYKEGYHHGDHLGLSNVDTDLIPFNIWEEVMIFGIQGIMVWGGLKLPTAEIYVEDSTALVTVAHSKLLEAVVASILSKDTEPTKTSEVALDRSTSLVTVSHNKSIEGIPDVDMDWYLLNAISAALLDDGGSYIDYTSAANSDTANDVNLLPAIPAIADSFLFGFSSTFAALHLKQETIGVGTWTITWKYWDGDSWEALSIIDDFTNGFRPTAGTWSHNRYRVSWTVPGDWAQTTIDSKNYYWIKAEVTSYASITTQPKGTRVWIETDTGSY